MAPVCDPIVRSILIRFVSKPGDAPRHRRPTLVLDGPLLALAEPLREANFIVIVGEGLDDFERRRALLSGRIIVTENSTDFIDDAPVMEFGVIGLDAMPRSASAAPLPENEMARMISSAFMNYTLGEERGPYLMLLHDSGHHVFRRLS